MTQSSLALEDEIEMLHVGYICAVIFCAFMFATFCIAPNVFLVISHFRKNPSLTELKAD